MATYSYTEAQFTNLGAGSINLGKLKQDVEASSIVSATLDYINYTVDSTVDFVFDLDLSGADETALNSIIDTHDGSEATPVIPTTPRDGDPWFDPTTRIPYYFDVVRDKWLSVNRENHVFSRRSNEDNVFENGNLSIGDVTHNSVGFATKNDLTLVSVHAKITGGFQTKIFNIVLGGSIIHPFALINGEYLNNDISVDIPKGEIISCEVSGSGEIENPIVEIELAWRP